MENIASCHQFYEYRNRALGLVCTTWISTWILRQLSRSKITPWSPPSVPSLCTAVLPDVLAYFRGSKKESDHRSRESCL